MIDEPPYDGEPMEYQVEWSDEDVPGVPLLALVVTTRGIAPMVMQPFVDLDSEDLPVVASEISRLLREAADRLQSDVELVRAVDEAMAPGSTDDDR